LGWLNSLQLHRFSQESPPPHSVTHFFHGKAQFNLHE
jgi:hypothetical protein